MGESGYTKSGSTLATYSTWITLCLLPMALPNTPDALQNAAPDSVTLDPKRKRLFFVGMLLLPVVFFLLLEGGLRLFSYGETLPLFVPLEANPDYYYPNQEVAKRYFGPESSVPNPNADFFRKKKAGNALRIVVQGESSAAGFPYYHGGSFSNMLKQRFKNTFPDREIEVINTGMAAVNSYTLLDFAEEIKAIQPDVVLIYAGHNEYYGALGVGSSESLGKFRFLIHWYLAFREYRTVQLLRNAMLRVSSWFRPENGEPSATLMEHMVGEQRIPLNSPLYQAGRAQFEDNMDQLLSFYQKAQIPVFIGTLASNERDHKPFISGLSAGTDVKRWKTLYQQAESALNARQQDALRLSQQLVQLDDASADAWYLRGKALSTFSDSTKANPEARKAFLNAKDRDELRFRAPEEFNTIIRQLAKKHSATVVESQTALAKASPAQLIGHNLMLEHLHPNLEGYLRISDAFYGALLAHYDFKSAGRSLNLDQARGLVLFSKADSLLSYYRIRQLMASWPFQPYGTIDHSLEQEVGNSQEEKIALKLLRKETSWFSALVELADFYRSRGQFVQAQQVGFALIDAYTPVPDPWIYMSEVYLSMNDVRQAQICVEQAVERMKKPEEAAEVLTRLGNEFMKRQLFPEAIPVFEASIAKHETYDAVKMLGPLYLRRSQIQNNPADLNRAIQLMERAMQQKSDDRQVLYNLAGAYAMNNQPDKAKSVLRAYLQVVPNDPDALSLLARLGG